MLFKLFGPNAYGRYVLKPIFLGLIIFTGVFLGMIHIEGIAANKIELYLGSALYGYVFGSIPSGYHVLDRFGSYMRKWTHQKRTATDRIIDAIYDSKRRNRRSLFSPIKGIIRFLISLTIGAFCFPYIVFDFFREIHRTRLYFKAKKKKINKANRRLHRE
ncbi:MAG: hypothetical protein K6T94_22350 [Paenibacillus sp.]|nr:hypothetical protein [Paenibacillus sp.]